MTVLNDDGRPDLVLYDTLGTIYVYDKITYDELWAFQTEDFFYGFSDLTDEPTKELILINQYNEVDEITIVNTVTNEELSFATGIQSYSEFAIWSAGHSDEKDKLLLFSNDHFEIWGDGSSGLSNTGNSSIEFGPATGTVPDFTVEADGVLDFEDLMIFTLMWNWKRPL